MMTTILVLITLWVAFFYYVLIYKNHTTKTFKNGNYVLWGFNNIVMFMMSLNTQLIIENKVICCIMATVNLICTLTIFVQLCRYGKNKVDKTQENQEEVKVVGPFDDTLYKK